MKNILVVGANSFIARNTIEKLVKENYNCILTYRNADSPSFTLDIENEESISLFCEHNANMSFDGILFLQGINPSLNAMGMTAEHFNRMLSVNLVGPTLLLKHINKTLNKGALVLFVSSIAAKKGSYDPSYAAAKSAMEGLMQSLGNEFSDFRFNSIALGLVEGSPVYYEMTQGFKERHAERMNNGFVKVCDVTTAIVELLKNGSINKVTLSIDRGFKN